VSVRPCAPCFSKKVTDKGDSCHLLRKDRAIVQIPLSEKHHFLGTLLGKALMILLVAFEKQRWINFGQIRGYFLVKLDVCTSRMGDQWKIL
jgi:hypothetical protein